MPQFENASPPQLIPETETMLGGPFFYDEERTMLLHDDFAELATEEELGARREVYIGALRVLAHVRADERSMADPVDSREWNEEWQQKLTMQKLGEIVTSQRDFMFPLSRRLAILNRAERSFEEGTAVEGLLDHQLPYMEQIISGLQKASRRVELPPSWPNRTDVFYSHGTTVNGPTGVGKTALMARLAKACGVGETLDLSNAEWLGENPPVRMVGVVPSQAGIARFLGETGEDLFGQLCPDVKRGGLNAHRRELDADAVFTTKYMLARHFSDGRLGDKHVDFLSIDEVHTLNGPIFAKVFLTHWEGTAIGFTATPAYNPRKDARNILRHEVKVHDVLEYAGKQLSDIEAYSILLHPQDFGLDVKELETKDIAELRKIRQEKVNETTRDFVMPLVSEGRRGIVFCEYGSDSLHAKNLAALLDGMELPDGRKLVVRTLGSFQGASDSVANRRIIQQYDAGEIDILTTTAMGQESLHFKEVNFVVAACVVRSALRMFQMGGRGLGRSELFDECVFANINTIGFGHHFYEAKTFEGVYSGRQTIHQGAIVRQERTASESVSRSSAATKKPRVRTRLFSPNIQGLLDRVDNKTMAQGLLGVNRSDTPVTEGYILSDDILNGVAIERSRGWSQLVRAGYRYEVRPTMKNERIELMGFFEPAASTYFTDDPQPPKDGLPLVSFRKFVARKEIMTLAEIGGEVHLGTQYILKYYLTPEERSMAAHVRTEENILNALTWPRAEGQAIVKRLREILVCPEHLVLAGAVARLLNAKLGTVTEFVRRSQEKLGVEKLQRGTASKVRHPALPWRSVDELVGRYGTDNPSLFDFDLEALPQTKDDRNPKKLRYAHEIQRRLGMSLDWIGSDPDDDESGDPLANNV